jgi:hypothetical protein
MENKKVADNLAHPAYKPHISCQQLDYISQAGRLQFELVTYSLTDTCFYAKSLNGKNIPFTSQTSFKDR